MIDVAVTRHGPPEVLEARTVPDPEPGPGEVRVRIEAIGVNFADVMIRMGLYPDAAKPPVVPGFEAAGVVDKVAEGADPALLGARVVCVTRSGCYAEAVVVPAAFALPIPDSLDAVTAAALPVNGLTAWQVLEVMAPPAAGETVLVHGAAGGVGLTAVQLAKRRGARVIGSASPSKHDVLRERGVDMVFDSRQPKFAATVCAATGGRGADVVLEPRHGRWIMESYRAAAPAGRVVLHGFADAAAGKRAGRLSALRTVLSSPWLRINPISLMNDNKALMGVNLGRMWGDAGRMLGWLREVVDLAIGGELVPVIDTVLPLEDAAAAHHRLQDRANIGKIVLVTERHREATA